MKNITILLTLVFLLPYCAYSQETIVLQPGPDEGIDAKSRKLSPDQNYGDARDITAHATDWLGPNISRSYIFFDLSNIPPGTLVLDARLSLYIQEDLPNYPPGQYGDNESVLQKITESWDEHTLTFNDAPSATEENQVYLERSIYELQNYEDIDVTQLVQEMIDSPQTNFGFRLKLINEIANTTLCFASSDYQIKEYRPKLGVTIDCGMPVSKFAYTRIHDTYYFIDESDSAKSWYWDFGDGNYSTLQNPENIFTEYGEYNVCLTTENDCGADMYCDSINYCPLAEAYFQYNSSGDSVQFINLSLNSDDLHWDFGDGYSTSLENPFHYYEGLGPYIVCLTAENECSNDMFCDTIDFTGIYDLFSELFYAIAYPNPNQGTLYFKVAGNKNCIKRISLFDIVGRRVYESESILPQEVNIDFLPEGVYFIRFESAKRIQSQKIQIIY